MNCISCQLCTDRAPRHFKMTEANANAYVYKQPETDEEKANCDEALVTCPVDAIGSNG